MEQTEPRGHGLGSLASEYAGVLISAHCAESRFVGEVRCDEGEFPGLMSKVENVSDEKIVWCLLGQAILQIGKKSRGSQTATF